MNAKLSAYTVINTAEHRLCSHPLLLCRTAFLPRPRDFLELSLTVLQQNRAVQRSARVLHVVQEADFVVELRQDRLFWVSVNPGDLPQCLRALDNGTAGDSACEKAIMFNDATQMECSRTSHNETSTVECTQRLLLTYE
jgi:hypothetical protein